MLQCSERTRRHEGLEKDSAALEQFIYVQSLEGLPPQRASKTLVSQLGKLVICVNGVLFLAPEAIAHDPRGMASAANISALIATIIFLLFVAASHGIVKKVTHGKSRKFGVTATLAFILASLALSMFAIYPALFFIIV